MRVELEAIKHAIKYEKKNGRTPKNVSGNRSIRGIDLQSSGRNIEVKGIGTTNGFVLFSHYNFKGLQKSNNYYLYVVYNVKTKPKIIIFNKSEVIKRIKSVHGWEISLRKRDFDKGI